MAFIYYRKRFRGITMREDIKKSLKHWFRMRKFVRSIIRNERENLLPDMRPYSNILGSNIKETWFSVDCPLCYKYLHGENSCDNCPILVFDTYCNNESSIWKKINKSKTWIEWLENSNAMIYLLWKTRNYKIEEGKFNEL